MPRKKKVEPVKQEPKELRLSICKLIREEQNTLVKKQMVLKEAIKSEDKRRLEFIERKTKVETRSLPVNIMKLIGSLKKAVRYKIRYIGGTPFSIIRDLFIYWDADKSGEMSAKELKSCMTSLGVIISYEQCDEVVQYYNDGIPNSEMKYKELLNDIQLGEPSLFSYVTEEEERELGGVDLHFEQFKEVFKEKPKIVQRFVEAVREWVQKLLRDVGGTPQEHIRFIFQFYDFDYSHGLYADELVIACKRSMKLKITDAQAESIVKYYDRKNIGQIHLESFEKDVCAHVKPVLTFTDLTPRGIAAHKKSLKSNPFIPRKYQATDNKILEKFKLNVQVALVNKINKLGGSIPSWVRDAFIFWDPGYTRKISSVESLKGACKRIGVAISDTEAMTIMKCYDRFNTGEMHYDFLSEDLTKEAPNFLMEGKLADDKITPTGRTPPNVISCIEKFKKACRKTAELSNNALNEQDFLHGTFVRFDKNKSGLLNSACFKMASKELKANISDTDLIDTIKWFDSTGSTSLDYNEFVIQAYGNDISTKKIQIPRLKNTKSMTRLALAKNETTYGATIKAPTYQQTYTNTDDDFGVSNAIKSKNLRVIESEATKLARMKKTRYKVIHDKKLLQKKIQDIDQQTKQILENYHLRKSQKVKANGKTSKVPLLALKQAMKEDRPETS